MNPPLRVIIIKPLSERLKDFWFFLLRFAVIILFFAICFKCFDVYLSSLFSSIWF